MPMAVAWGPEGMNWEWKGWNGFSLLPGRLHCLLLKEDLKGVGYLRLVTGPKARVGWSSKKMQHKGTRYARVMLTLRHYLKFLDICCVIVGSTPHFAFV